MANKPTPDWEHARIRTLDLPSGGEADVDPVDNTELLYGDPENGIEPSIPNELIAMAEQTEYTGSDPEKMEPADRITFSRYRRWIVADRTRRYHHVDGWEVSSLSPKDVRNLPYDDMIAMFRAVLHMDLAERVLVATFRREQADVASNGSGKAEGDTPECSPSASAAGGAPTASMRPSWSARPWLPNGSGTRNRRGTAHPLLRVTGCSSGCGRTG